MYVSIEMKASLEMIKPGLIRRLMYLKNILTALFDIEKSMNKPDPQHSHTQKQINYVTDGELLIFIGDSKFRLNKGDMFMFPSEVPHTVQPLTSNVRIIDSFRPIREDFLKMNDFRYLPIINH